MASQLCGKAYHLVENIESGAGSFTAVAHRCKSWDCPVCRRSKSKRVSAAIDRQFANGHLYFYTITFNHEESLEETWRNSGAAWNSLMSYVRRRFKHLTFIRIVEPHKSVPYPHFHILCNQDIFTRDVFLYSKTLGFGQQQQMQKVSSGRAQQYITKYLGKAWPDNGSHQIRKKTRTRVLSYSHDFGSLFYSKPVGKVIGHFLSAGEISAQLSRLSIESTAKELYLSDFTVEEKYAKITYSAVDSDSMIGEVYRIRIVHGIEDKELILYQREVFKQELAPLVFLTTPQ